MSYRQQQYNDMSYYHPQTQDMSSYVAVEGALTKDNCNVFGLTPREVRYLKVGWTCSNTPGTRVGQGSRVQSLSINKNQIEQIMNRERKKKESQC